jgi:hypothetical protein
VTLYGVCEGFCARELTVVAFVKVFGKRLGTLLGGNGLPDGACCGLAVAATTGDDTLALHTGDDAGPAVVMIAGRAVGAADTGSVGTQ